MTTRKHPFALPFPIESLAIQLPLWPETKRGTPNTILRSALFTATQGRHRRVMTAEPIATLKDTAIEFTGEQLTQSDLDVWQALLHLARIYPLGSDCVFSGYAILKLLNRQKGKSQREWLRATMIRLSICAITVRRKHFIFVGHIIDSFSSDDRAYCVRLNKDLTKLFGFADWTQIDWRERYRLLKQPLAQWLHGYWSTHSNPLAISVEALHRLCGTNIHKLKYFRRSLRVALQVLVETRFLTGYEFDDRDLLTVRRA